MVQVKPREQSLLSFFHDVRNLAESGEFLQFQQEVRIEGCYGEDITDLQIFLLYLKALVE